MTRSDRGVRVPRRPRAHRVGLTASTLGLLACTLMPFATFRTSRIQTGDAVSSLDALGPVLFGVLVAVWLTVAVLSLREGERPLSPALRGLAASAALLGTVALCEIAAQRLLADAGPFARVSIAAGAWVSIAAAYSLILASRREVGATRPTGIVLSTLAPLGVGIMLATGYLGDLAILREYANQAERFRTEILAHLTFSAAAMGVAIALGVLLGTLAFRRPRLKTPIFTVVSVFQTIPGLAMVGLLFAPLSWLGSNVPALKALGIGGLGWAPVVTALTLYALLAVVRNTYAGLAGVPAETVEAGRGMGMTEAQLMLRVRFPLAMPVIFGGIRTAAVQTLGNATLGAFVAAGTLGLFVFGGLSQQATDLIMLGSVTLVLLALLLDGALRVLQRLVSPRHTARSEGAAA